MKMRKAERYMKKGKVEKLGRQRCTGRISSKYTQREYQTMKYKTEHPEKHRSREWG